MNALASAGSILAIDEHITDDRFNVTVVTEASVIHAGLKPSSRESVLAAIHKGEDPVTTMQHVTRGGHAPRVVSLDALCGLEWHEDDDWLHLRHRDDRRGKIGHTEVALGDTDSRQRIIQVIQDSVGTPFEQTQQRASIWHTGMIQLIISAVALLIFGSLALVGHLSSLRAASASADAARGHETDSLHLLFPPSVMLLVGLGVIAAMMLWWCIACRNSTTRQIAIPVRES